MADSQQAMLGDDSTDGSRFSRLQLREKLYRDQQEATHLRLIAREALLKRESAERDTLESSVQLAVPTNQGTFLQNELQELRASLSEAELRSVNADLVRIDLQPTAFKKVSIVIRPGEGYPNEVAVIELSSQTLCPALVTKLQNAATKEAQLRISGSQILPVVHRVRTILNSNILAAAYDDLQQIKQLCTTHPECQLISAKEREGVVELRLQSAEYYAQLRFQLTADYPERAPHIEAVSFNLPQHLLASFLVQAMDEGSRLAGPGGSSHVATMEVGREGAGSGPSSKSAKKNVFQTMTSLKMEAKLKDSAQQREQEAERLRAAACGVCPSPSLFAQVKLLHSRIVTMAQGSCACCGKRLLPAKSAMINKIPKGMEVEGLYCRHFFHFTCLSNYITSPPFDKGCPTCGGKLSHPRFVTNQQVLEQRWALRAARQREISDVEDCFG